MRLKKIRKHSRQEVKDWMLVLTFVCKLGSLGVHLPCALDGKRGRNGKQTGRDSICNFLGHSILTYSFFWALMQLCFSLFLHTIHIIILAPSRTIHNLFHINLRLPLIMLGRITRRP